MTIKLETLRCFVAVAESGNLADAAARLNRTPSAISMTMKGLEEHLGKPLFASDRKNKLSPLGHFVFERATSELNQFDRTMQAIERYASTDAALVRVAAVPSMAASLLPTALKRFVRSHPDVCIDLRDMDSDEVLHSVRQQRVDIGIGTFADERWGGDRTHLFSDEFGLVCADNHHLADSSDPVQWQALEGESFIANALCRSIGAPILERICERALLVSHNTTSLMAMVKSGMGITVLPRQVVQLFPGGTVFRRIDDTRVERRIDLICRDGGAAQESTRILVGLIVDAARPMRDG